jgi:hypothetical protein
MDRRSTHALIGRVTHYRHARIRAILLDVRPGAFGTSIVNSYNQEHFRPDPRDDVENVLP